MKTILNHAAWGWMMVRRPYGLLCGLFAAQQLVILLLLAAQQSNAGGWYTWYYFHGMQAPLLVVAWLAAGVMSARMLWQANGRTKAGYTLLTLPQSRGDLLAGQILLCAGMQLGMLAWQLVLYALFRLPVMAVANRVAEGVLSQPIPASSLFEQLYINPLFHLMLPARPVAALWLWGWWLASAVVIPCIFVHKGAKRVLQGIVSCAVLALGGVQNLLEYYRWQGSADLSRLQMLELPALVLVLTVFSLVWALRALRRSEFV